MCGWVGYDVKDILAVLCSDADWAGLEGKHSTSGSFCCMKGEKLSSPSQPGVNDRHAPPHLLLGQNLPQPKPRCRSKVCLCKRFGN